MKKSKTIIGQVFPIENYTDKIHTGLKVMFKACPLISFTRDQMKVHLQRGYPWLQTLTEIQSTLLNQLIVTGIKKLIQAGIVKKVMSKFSVDNQWQLAITVSASGYFNATSESAVAVTDEARKACERRAIGGRSLQRLNGKVKLGVLHA